jgi:hypothetical protein
MGRKSCIPSLSSSAAGSNSVVGVGLTRGLTGGLTIESGSAARAGLAVEAGSAVEASSAVEATTRSRTRGAEVRVSREAALV